MKDSEKTRDIKKIVCTAVSESWEMSVILVYGDVCTVTCTVRPCVVFLGLVAGWLKQKAGCFSRDGLCWRSPATSNFLL